MSEQPKDIEKGKIEAAPGVSTAKVFLGEDQVLRVEIDLKVPDGMEVEGRVGAYGTIMWAYQIASRYFDLKEMRLARKRAEDTELNKSKGLIVPKPIVPNIH